MGQERSVSKQSLCVKKLWFSGIYRHFIRMVPQNYITLTDETDIKNMEKLIDMLEDNDDVQNVYHNWEQ